MAALSKRVKRLALLAPLAAVMSLVACGDSGPTVIVLVEADLSSSQPADAEQVLSQVQSVLQSRVDEFGGDAEATVIEGTNRVLVEIRRVEADTAETLIGSTGRLELREPILDELGNVVCIHESGTAFAVSSEEVTEIRLNSGETVVVCEGAATGVVLWEPAAPEDGQAPEHTITGPSVAAVEVIEGVPPACAPACVVVHFTVIGSLIFDQIVSNLGEELPLAIFFDDSLITAPLVGEPLLGDPIRIRTNHRTQADVLAAIISAGPLPVSITLISVEIED